MPMQDNFRDFIAAAVTGNGLTYFDSDNAHVGVGDGDAAINSSHTDLQGTNKIRRKVKTGYPTVSGNDMVFEARFEEADAVFHWKETGIFNAANAGLMMNRALADHGEKPNNQIWDHKVTVTVEVGT